MEYFIVDAFTDQLSGGNPIGMVFLDTQTFLPEDLILKTATEMHYLETKTAFIRRHSSQEFAFIFHNGHNVEAQKRFAIFTNYAPTDLGIAKCYFKIGTGKEIFE